MDLLNYKEDKLAEKLRRIQYVGMSKEEFAKSFDPEEIDMIEKALVGINDINDNIEKGNAANIGEVRDWGGTKYRKIAAGKWEPASEQRFTGREDPSVRVSGGGKKSPAQNRRMSAQERAAEKASMKEARKTKRAELTAANKKQRQEDRKNDPSYKWNPAKYDQWIKESASISDGGKVEQDYAADMADNAYQEAGLIEYVERKIRTEGGDESAIDRIQWDIEAKIPDSAYNDDDDYEEKSIEPDIEKQEEPKKEAKVAKVMKEFKDGTLKSSSGELVTDRDQAIAIAMSEAGIEKGCHDLEKGGEGSRGGKVIGHTKSGKPIYENLKSGASEYRDFTREDHNDASQVHLDHKREK